MSERTQRLTEVDLVRSLTAAGVVLLHVLGFFIGVDVVGGGAYRLDQLLIELTRFSRQVFMLVTGLILAYSYRAKTVEPETFWRKRARSVALPYVVWTFIYLGLTWAYGMAPLNGSAPVVVLRSLLTGDGYYHLYYIVVSLQFYLVFPWLLPWLRRLDVRRAGRLGVALGAAYLGLLALLARYPYALPLPAGGLFAGRLGDVLQTLYVYRDRLLLTYAPYFLIGALLGLHLDEVRAFVERNRRAVLGATTLVVVYLTADWYLRVVAAGQDFNVFDTVFRPAMLVYSLLALGSLYLVAKVLARSGGRVAGALRAMAPHTFGIYLIHPLVLFLLEQYVFVDFSKLHPLFIIPLWLLGVGLSYEAARLLAATPLGEALFGTTGHQRPATSRPSGAPVAHEARV